jgi:hypothetical protein
MAVLERIHVLLTEAAHLRQDMDAAFTREDAMRRQACGLPRHTHLIPHLIASGSAALARRNGQL